jgi:hypothetical protein
LGVRRRERGEERGKLGRWRAPEQRGAEWSRRQW